MEKQQINAFIHDYIKEHLVIKAEIITKPYDSDIYVSVKLLLDEEEVSTSEDYINSCTITRMSNRNNWDD